MLFILYQATILFGMLIIYILIEMNELDFGKMTPLIVAVGFLYFLYTSYLEIYERPKDTTVAKKYIYLFFIPGVILCLYIVIKIFFKYY